ncbi:hypothetical protein MTP99_008803 [Tenebrio molitor]|jgi:hypothetical protein|nr:hypothetical protein MTP99_008803 [Tenebrio molitor]
MCAADLQHVEFMVGEKDSSGEEVHGVGNLICPLRGGREEVVEGRNLARNVRRDARWRIFCGRGRDPALSSIKSVG